MAKKRELTPTRRTVLSGIGTGLAGLVGTGAAARNGSGYALVQGDTCVSVQPLRGQLTAETFYEYRLPEKHVAAVNGAVVGESQQYSSAGTTELQRAKTSIAFLYQGPKGLSLVVVHGSASASDGGSVSFRLSGVPNGAEWVVRDDYYGDLDAGNLRNYDRWRTDGTDHRVDWTWGSGGTDGGVLRDLGDEFELIVEPAFNEAAALYGEYYEGTVEDWQFLSGSAGVSKRVSLDLGEPIRILTGSCGDGSGGSGGNSASEEPKENEQKQTEQKRERKEEKQGRKEEKREKKQEQKEERRERKEEKREEKQERKEEKQERKEEKRENPGEGHEKGRGKGHEIGRGEGHDGDDDEDGDD